LLQEEERNYKAQGLAKFGIQFDTIYQTFFLSFSLGARHILHSNIL